MIMTKYKFDGLKVVLAFKPEAGHSEPLWEDLHE